MDRFPHPPSTLPPHSLAFPAGNAYAGQRYIIHVSNQIAKFLTLAIKYPDIMKPLFTIWICTLSVSLLAREPSTNYYSAIKSFNLSKLWLPGKIHDIGSGTEQSTIDTEPLGFIGDNYQRFYIHYTSVVKDKANPYKYLIKGKTKVKDNICSFSGTITIIKADLFNESDDQQYREGAVTCSVILNEDNSQTGSGEIIGTLITNWCLDKQGRIYYDSINSEADGFNNNQCEADWTSYKTHKSKKCNWGDFRIPASGDLDTGAGEFYVNEKYLNNGWGNYMMSLQNGKPGYAEAVAEENKKWW